MKVSLAPSIGCTLLLIIGCLRVVGAAKFRISVPSGDGFNFFLDRFDDGRTKPYLVTFTSSGFKSVYKFTEDGSVTNIKAGDETYTIGYDDNDEIETVERTSTHRKLVVDQEYEEDGEDIQTYQQPPSREGGEDIQTYQQTLYSAQTRRLFTCDDCELAWETVCNAGVETVCNLEDFGEPVLSAGETSIGVLCNTFGGICSQRTASEVCDGSCDGVECLSPLTITLEWTGGSGLSARQEPKLDLYVIEPGGQTTMNRYSGQGFGVLTNTASKRTYKMLSGLDPDSAKGTYIVFGEWWEGFAPISWTMTATDGTGRVVDSAEGMFTGDCGTTMTSSSTISNSDQGTSRGTTNLIYVELFEYVDNGCKVD